MQVFYLHAGGMLTGFGLLAAGVVIAMRRPRPWWFAAHRGVGTLGALTMLGGLAAAITLVALSSGRHLAGLHAAVGSMALLCVQLTAILGYLQRKIRDKKIRAAHRWLGRITIVLGAAAVALGLNLAGLI